MYRISLITKPHNKKAIKFYNKMGFKSYETFKIDDINVFED